MFARVAIADMGPAASRAKLAGLWGQSGRRSLAIHAGALAGVVGATLLTGLVDQIAQGRYAVFLFFSAVVFVSASMRLSAGLIATAASTWAAFFFFFQPERTWEVTVESGVLCALFFLMNTAISIVTWRTQKAIRAEAAAAHPAAASGDPLERSSAVLGMVSHELRNRLAAMSMSADLLLRQGKRLGEKDTDELIEEIRSDVERLNAVFDNLLSLSRLGSGAAAESEPCSVRPFMRDLLARMARRLDGAEVHVVIEPELPLVQAVPTYLEQILRNLIINARKYGGEDSPVEVCAWVTEARTVCLSVRDHGPGVSPSELEKIFDPFYRSPKSAGQAAGFGLGLPVSRRMAEEMGGALIAHLPADGGLELVLTLPECSESLVEA